MYMHFITCFKLEDGTVRVFICAGGDKKAVLEDYKDLIEYLIGNAVNSNFSSRIDMEVHEAVSKQPTNLLGTRCHTIQFILFLFFRPKNWLTATKK